MKHLVSILAIMIIIVGCSGPDGHPQVVPVSGVITYKGAPVAGARVSFVSPNSSRSSDGVTNEQGEFTVTTMNTGDGALVGDNLITVAFIDESAPAAQRFSGPSPEAAKSLTKEMQTLQDAPEKKAGPKKSLLPLKYLDPKKSGLKRSVVAGEKNHFKIDLTD